MKASTRTVIAAGVLALAAGAAQAALVWNWAYAGSGINASGSFTTSDLVDAQGFYTITGITGQRNGVAITGLTPAGTPIPGNEPFAVDNLVSIAGDQLTVDGIGFSMADGNYANVFFASFLPTPGPLEFFSAAPFVPGNPGPEDSELSVSFRASLVTNVPEPSGLALVAMALLALRAARWRPAGSA